MNKDTLRAEEIIADKRFKYLGSSIVLIDIVDSIKSGDRLININQLDKNLTRFKEYVAKYNKPCEIDEVVGMIERIEKMIKEAIGDDRTERSANEAS